MTLIPRPLPHKPAPKPLAAALASACLLALLSPAATLAAPIETLPGVVVSATRHAMALADAPAAISVITAAQIEQRGADNVLEALRGETGVALFGRTISGRKTISLRGMDARHTLILVDGRRIGASDGVIGHSDFQLDWVAVDEIERIEVLRGPLSVLYGAEAMGGVVQIFTRGPARERLEASARAEALQADGERGGDGHRASLRLSAPLGERLGATLTLADGRRQAVASSVDPRVSALEMRHKQDAALRLQWRPSSTQQLDLVQRSGVEQRSARMVERSGKKRVYDSDTRIERSHSALDWSADWGGAHELRSQLRAYESRIRMDNQRSQGVVALAPNALRDRVLELQGSGRLGAAQLLTAGAELRQERLLNAGLPGGGASVQHRSVFVQDEWELSPALRLTAGLRHDRHERFGSEVSPRLYGVWHFAPGWTLKGGVSAGFKPPTLKQATPGFREDEGPYTFVANPLLRPETNRAAELGLGWDRADLGWQAMVFDNHVDDLVQATLIGAVGVRQTLRFDNVERARLRGLELGGRAALGAGFTLGLSYQYLDARDAHSGQRLEKRPRHALGLKLGWQQGPWRAHLQADRAMDQRLATGVAGQPAQAVPDISQTSAGLGYAISPRLDLDLGVSNIANTDLAKRSPLFTWSEAPRTWRLSLRGRW